MSEPSNIRSVSVFGKNVVGVVYGEYGVSIWDRVQGVRLWSFKMDKAVNEIGLVKVQNSLKMWISDTEGSFFLSKETKISSTKLHHLEGKTRSGTGTSKNPPFEEINSQRMDVIRSKVIKKVEIISNTSNSDTTTKINEAKNNDRTKNSPKNSKISKDQRIASRKLMLIDEDDEIMDLPTFKDAYSHPNYPNTGQEEEKIDDFVVEKHKRMEISNRLGRYQSLASRQAPFMTSSTENSEYPEYLC